MATENIKQVSVKAMIDAEFPTNSELHLKLVDCQTQFDDLG